MDALRFSGEDRADRLALHLRAGEARRIGFRPYAAELKLFFQRLVPALVLPGWPRPLTSAPALTAQQRTGPSNFDGLRLIAALMIVYGHEGLDGTGTAGLRLLMFFSISGYLIAGSWRADPHLGRFLVRRFLRLWPAYAFCIVTCAALSAAFPAPDMPEISRLASLHYLQRLWFDSFDWGFFPFRFPLMNGPLWMINFEVDFYLAFAALAWLNSRLLLPVAAALLLTALMGAQGDDLRSYGGLLESWSLKFTGYFAFGVLLREWPALARSGVLGVVMLCGAALTALGRGEVGLMLFSPSAAVWIGNRSWPVLRSAARFGDLSLGIFLWAWPVRQVVRLWMSGTAPSLARFGIVLGLSLVLAWLSYRYIEAPALRRKPPRPARAGPAGALQTSI
jgi:peptidoglycan/LPS O-acetylase OafA/YrhL